MQLLIFWSEIIALQHPIFKRAPHQICKKSYDEDNVSSLQYEFSSLSAALLAVSALHDCAADGQYHNNDTFERAEWPMAKENV